jgi:hypothetical protein
VERKRRSIGRRRSFEPVEEETTLPSAVDANSKIVIIKYYTNFYIY